MLAARVGPVTGPAFLFLLLAGLEATAGLGAAGWATGVLCGAGATVWVARGLTREEHVLGPADLVTLARAMLSCAVAGLVVAALVDPPAASALVPLAVLALLLDLVDGPVARRTGTVSRFGGRFDGEADAFLMLVLSVHVAPLVGAWVLALGLVRYAFGAAVLVLPWMRSPLPPRYWRKVVTATAGVALVVAAADVAPRWLGVGLLLLAAALLAESFGRDVVWLRREAARGDLGRRAGRTPASPAVPGGPVAW